MEEETTDIDSYAYDVVTGKKEKINLLSRKTVSKYDMDNFFNNYEED